MEGAAGVGPNGGSEVGMGGVMSEAQRPPVQLDLLPLAPPLRALHSHLSVSTCLTQYGNGKCCDGEMAVDFSVHPGRRGGRGSSHASSHGKKLRLCKEQSAYLDECLKEHTSTILYPKQKLALAWQLNLRPRQIEVWLQNRKVRSKLKQTEAEYKYMKRCCETLTEENQRIQKEIQELRDLKVAHPFYMHLPLPPTTLSMCPSCQRVATNDNENPLKSFLRFPPPQ